MKYFIIILSGIILSAAEVNSQNAINVRGMSMGKTSVSGSYAIDAFNNNPANISLQKSNDSAKIYFNVFTNLNYQSNSGFFSYSFYNNYFTKNSNSEPVFLTESDKAYIIEKASGQPVNVSSNVKDIAFIYNTKNSGSFGIAVDERAAANFSLNGDFLELGLYGNELNRVYDMSGSYYNLTWIREINLSYAKNFKIKKSSFIDNISAGMSVKPQFGVYYANTSDNDLSVVTNSEYEIQGSGTAEFLYAGSAEDNSPQLTFSPAGFGFGFDVGINAEIKNVSPKGQLNFGLSINDIGYIKWTKNTNKYYYDGSFIITDITKHEQIDSLKELIKSTKTPVPAFTTSLPLNLRAGFTYKIFSSKPENYTLETASISIEYIQGFSNTFGSTKKPMLGIGGEYNLSKVISPRIGMTLGGNEKFVLSLGLGIDTGPVIFDIGTHSISSIINSKNATNFSGAFSMKFKIN